MAAENLCVPLLGDLLERNCKAAPDWANISLELLQLSGKSAPDWTSLPPEILQLVARKLTHIADFAKFRCVCSSWRSAACPTDLQPQSPWLVLPCYGTILSFFSPSDKRVYEFHDQVKTTVPKDRVFAIGSSYGWLVIIKRESLAVSLLNPITRVRIPLPRRPRTGKITLPKALICFNPSSIHKLPRQTLKVVIWFNEKIFFIRHGDEHWGQIKAPIISQAGSMIYFEKRLHLVNNWGGLMIFDTASLKLRQVINNMERLPDYSFNYAHLVEARGNLLLIGWVPNSEIQFFWLDRSAQDLKWARTVDGVGDITLLTSSQHSISVCDSKFLNGKGNEVCMFGNTSFHKKSAWDIELVSGVKSTRMEMPLHYEGVYTSWMIPSLH